MRTFIELSIEELSKLIDGSAPNEVLSALAILEVLSGKIDSLEAQLVAVAQMINDGNFLDNNDIDEFIESYVNNISSCTQERMAK